MNEDIWAGGKEVEAPALELEEKECEGQNCLSSFMPQWHTQRRCPRCRKEKRPYRDSNSPF